MMEKVEKRLTVEEFLEMSERPEYAGYRMELIDGEVYMTAAFSDHGEVAARILLKIGRFVDDHRLGRMVAAETGISIDQNSHIAPDGGFYSYARAPEPLPRTYSKLAPDLVFEVLSQGNTTEEIMAKIEKYVSRGCRMIWVVSPPMRHVWVYTPNPDGTLTISDFGMEDTLTGGDVLPGFELPVRAIFEDPNDAA